MLGRHDSIRFLIRCIICSNLASIVCYFLGYTKIMICNHQFVVYGLPGDFYETRHYWLYSHKSEYALMLVAFIALFVAYREKFRNWFTYLCSVTLLLFCLYLSHSWTGIICVALIFAGELLDRADWKKFRWKKRYLLVRRCGFSGSRSSQPYLSRTQCVFPWRKTADLGGCLEDHSEISGRLGNAFRRICHGSGRGLAGK